jgi:hypothetical protein
MMRPCVVGTAQQSAAHRLYAPEEAS